MIHPRGERQALSSPTDVNGYDGAASLPQSGVFSLVHALFVFQCHVQEPVQYHQSSFPVSAALVALAGCASSGTSIDHDIDLVVAPLIQAALAPHKPTLPASAELASVAATVSIDHKGNFGRLATDEQRQAFFWQPDGRLASSSTGVFRSPTGMVNVWTASALSLCGLVTLLDESAGDTESPTTAAIPAGGVLVPFGFSSKSQSARRVRITGFSTGETNLCKPTAGSTFMFQYNWEEQRKYEASLISTNRLYTIAESVTCTVGSTAQPASALNASLVGDYLPVSCVHSEPSKPERKSEFAYLVSSGMYLPLFDQVNEYQANTTRYTAIGYK